MESEMVERLSEIEKAIMQSIRRSQERNKKLKQYLVSNHDKLWPQAKEYMESL
jgi:hypothetical protein